MRAVCVAAILYLLLRVTAGQSLFDAIPGLEKIPVPVEGKNLPPRFLPDGDMNGFSLPEDTPVGTSVYKLKAEDPEGQRIAYSISGDYLSVVRNTGTVTLVKELDRESQDILEVIITITDEKSNNMEPNIVSIRREIIIEDRNDNPPKFGTNTYFVNVNETEPVGFQIPNKISITDPDLGANGNVTLTCLNERTEVGCDKFTLHLHRVADDKLGVVLMVRRPLDYETNNLGHVIEVQARDSGSPSLSSEATIIIKLGDVQDQPPVFLNGPYTAMINENTDASKPVVEVTFRDGDVHLPRNLTLDIVNDPEGYFKISSILNRENVATATIVTTSNRIDREHDSVMRNGGVYTFSIQAKELLDDGTVADSSHAEVSAFVIDQDDEPPRFQQSHYNVSVPENLKTGDLVPGLEMLVSDGDSSSDNSYFDLSIFGVKNADGDLFQVHPSSGKGSVPVTIRLLDGSRLDYEDAERREMVVEVVATSRGRLHSSTATVTILVTDVDDNEPVFQNDSYTKTVSEDLVPSSLVISLGANASLPSGSVSYAIAGFGADDFCLNSTSGDLSAGNCLGKSGLDYEKQNSYMLTATAVDGAGRASSAQLIINVQNVNDIRPVFDEAAGYKGHLEKNRINALPLKATAHDPKSNITYSIVSGNGDRLFTIDDGDGTIEIDPTIDTSEIRGPFNLTVNAVDSGTPPLDTDVRVVITVGVDSGGNEAPSFPLELLQHVIHLKEHESSEAFSYQVNATDREDGPGELRYKLIGGSIVDWFVIDEATGVIKIAPGAELQLDNDPETSHTLTVLAMDRGTPRPQTATATLSVKLTDVNNKSPRFTKPTFVHHVDEVTPVGSQVLQLEAHDADSNPQLRFQLGDTLETRNKGGHRTNHQSERYFTIDETSGMLTLAKALNHDKAAILLFSVSVTDVNADVDFGDQSDVAQVIIYVQAYTDDEPIFTPNWSRARPIIKVEVAEEQDPGALILSLKAHDPITGILINHYQLVSEVSDASDERSDLFSTQDVIVADSESTSSFRDGDAISSLIALNPETGEISFKKRVDYEELENKTIQFQVEAVAGKAGAPRMSRATIQLEVLDINDNGPIFSQKEYNVKVAESIRYPEILVTVSATDRDSGKFGQIQYYVAGDGVDLFVIEDPASGVVRVAGNVSLDREKRPSYTFTVIAADQPQGSHETKILVNVLVADVNDNGPTFTQSSYTAVVAENAPLDWSVSQVQAVDPDEGPGGAVEYFLVNEDRLEGLLSLVSHTGNIVVKGPLTGKGRSSPYSLTVRAQDKGDPQMFTDKEVNVYVGDITTNDGVPSFIRPAFNEQAFVAEESPINTSVFQALAVDPDDPSTPNGRLTYKFLDDGTLGTDHAFFDIHSVSGLVTTKARLDRESKSSYTLVLVARDQGTPFQQATRILHVVIKDIDDHPPQFVRTPYDGPLQFSVLEEREPGWEVDTFKAMDPDQLENADIEYLIIYGDDTGMFSLKRNADNSAVLLVRGRVDRESAAYHLLTVKCFRPVERPSELRKNYNPQDMSEIQINVTVRDIDDNDPVFRETNISTGVSLDVPLHFEVERLEAVDPDTESGPMFYKIDKVVYTRVNQYDENVNNTFHLDMTTGSLTTSTTYGPFVNGYFNLTVAAWTSDETRSRKAYTNLKINILREPELTRFVFNRTGPRDWSAFSKSVEQAFDLPMTLNFYESQFYSADDAGPCFQLVGKDHYVFKTESTAGLLNKGSDNKKLEKVYADYFVAGVERCVEAQYEVSNVEIWLLVIGCVVGAVGLVAALTICCLFTKYEGKMSKLVLGFKVADRVMPPRPQPSLGPASIAADSRRIYEWQEHALALDSRSSVLRSAV